MVRITKFLICAAFLSSLLASGVRAQTINAASCNETDVAAALSQITTDGATVVIPAGTCKWTQVLSYSQAHSFILQGQTQISGTCAPGASCTAIDSTVIIDDTPHSTDGDQPMMSFSLISGKSFRLTGITFETDSSSQESFNSGGLTLSGSSAQARIDHSHFAMTLHATQIAIFGCVYGVADHFVMDFQAGSTHNGFREYNGQCTDSVGNTVWNAVTGLGGANFWFTENFVMNGGTSGSNFVIPFANDCLRGGKFVFRFGTLNAVEPQGHATGSASNFRSCRAFEIYGISYGASNTSTSYPATSAFFLTGGTGVIWGNTFTGYYAHVVAGFVDRVDNTTYGQSAPPNGWGYCRTAAIGGVPGPSNWDGNSSGESGWPCLDGIGRGQGDLLSGSFPSLCDSTLGSGRPGGCGSGSYTGVWPNQYLEPVYEWLDSWTPVPGFGTNFWTEADSVTVRNRDYYLSSNVGSGSNCTGFTGASGVGCGTLASRPANCTAGPGGTYGAGPTGSPGVAYWATDQGNWNQSGNGGQGELYVCTASGSPGTWTLYYEPYTYPHPLAVNTPSAVPPNAPMATPH